ncbi:MAG: SDR family NAD(P)-dependent oxidoreductase [Cyanobacteria bacterium P01_D01_bin.36]
MMLSLLSHQQPFKNKTIVLTGASGGIGLELSHALAEQGANIIAIAKSQAKLSIWANDLKPFGIKTAIIPFDLSKTDQFFSLTCKIIDAVHQFSESSSAHIDVLINNAGIEIYRAFQDYSTDEIEKVIRVNLLAAMELTHQLMPHLASDARIVNMASLASKKSHPYDSVYAASKAGLLLWGHSLRQELAHTDISVCAICPGYVSDQGMLANTGTQAPWLAGRSRAEAVATATLKATHRRRCETIINQDPFTQFLTRLLLATEQLWPHLTDFSNKWMGITQANRQRASRTSASLRPRCSIPRGGPV